MPHFRLILAYDGTPYHGWQIQPGLATVQGLLSDALFRIASERVLPQGSGRTDAGVHALAQVASFSLAAPIPAANLRRALNHCLPPSIRVLSVDTVPPEFHARHSAVSKTYEYRIFPARSATNPGAPGLDSETWETNICPPFLAPFVWPCPWPLDLDTLNRAAAHVLGTHDFTTFAAAPSTEEDTPATYIRTITHSGWRAEDNLLLYRVTANGFLHHMVRNLVGTFVRCGAQAGTHRLSPDAIPSLLAARDRALSGPTAPPSGLFLVSVDYPALGSFTSEPQSALAAEPLRT